MSEKQTITLGGKSYPVEAVPLGRLKVLLPALSAFSLAVSQTSATRHLSEAEMNHALTAVSAGLGLSVAEVEQIPATLNELIEAVGTLAQVSGLTAKGGVDLGEATPGETPATTDSTQLTASLPTS